MEYLLLGSLFLIGVGLYGLATVQLVHAHMVLVAWMCDTPAATNDSGMQVERILFRFRIWRYWSNLQLLGFSFMIATLTTIVVQHFPSYWGITLVFSFATVLATWPLFRGRPDIRQ